MKPTCHVCHRTATYADSTHCNYCSRKYLTPEELEEFQSKKAQKTEETVIHQELLKSSATLNVSTLPLPSNMQNAQLLGLVFGTSSKQAFWGLSTQADRLSRAYQAALSNLKYEAAMLGADSVYGVTFALNNSTGSGNTFLAGSSEAVMLLGTAVKTK